MSELVIQPFTIQPLVGLHDGSAILRWAYNRPFLDSDNVQVQWGTQSSGFGINVPCSIASGLVSIDQDSTLWTTDNALDRSPLTILISAWLLSSQGKLIQQLLIAGKPQWVVPSSQIPTTTWNEFSIYNQAVSLYYYNPNFYNAPQTDAQIRAFAETNYASDTNLGGVFTSITPSQPTDPVAWITDDPLVRDAIKIQSVDVTTNAPTDGMALVYSQALNSYNPTLVGPASGNVISNEVSSVDGEMVVFSGTSGKEIKKAAALTTSVLPKSDGTGLVDSRITDDGTTITEETRSARIGTTNDNFTRLDLDDTTQHVSLGTSSSINSGNAVANLDLSFTGTGSTPKVVLLTSEETTGATTTQITQDGGAGTISLDASQVTVNGFSIGYLEIPQNPQTGTYTAVLADSGKQLYHPDTDNNPCTFNIPPSTGGGAVLYEIGAAIVFINGINTMTIAIVTDTLIWAQDGSTGSRTLAASGIATAIKVTNSRWIISGTGLS